MGQETETADLIDILGERIYEPTVTYFFNEFIAYGCIDACEKLYEHIYDPMAVSVLRSVQSTQVNREKALWPIYIACGQDLNVERAVQLGAAVDLLWSLSTIMDDIEDGDTTRAETETIWASLGKEKTEELAHIGLDGVISYLNATNGEGIGQLAYRYVIQGMKSLELHRNLGLNADFGAIIQNYWMRDDFHSAFPFHALFGNNTSEAARRVIGSFRRFNQASQILNDLSDLRLQRDNTYRLSDLTGGRVSYALKLLYESTNESERLIIERCFGAECISDNDAYFILEMARNPQYVEAIGQYVKRLYRLSHSIISAYFLDRDSAKMLSWVEYKLRKLK